MSVILLRAFAFGLFIQAVKSQGTYIYTHNNIYICAVMLFFSMQEACYMYGLWYYVYDIQHL